MEKKIIKRHRPKTKGKLIKAFLYGKVRLELYDKTFFVVFKGNKEVYWIELEKLKEIMEKFKNEKDRIKLNKILS